jgi:2,4-dienoyl-CoA reductase-like NADH-dependent reductase (Old Yellow Enzyme family)
MIVVRLSVFDTVPYKTSREIGEPLPYSNLLPYEYGFGVDASDPLKIDLREPIEVIRRLHSAGVVAVNITAGSPYYNPHIQRPAIFPPSDGYQPPEDPLVGVARQIHVARECKQAVPEMTMVGTGYSYLQDYLPHVAQATVRAGWIDAVGLGRMVLAYPQLPADSLSSGNLARKLICRTFSDCTTAPRNGMISGCFPLDPYYKSLPEAEALKKIKAEIF